MRALTVLLGLLAIVALVAIVAYLVFRLRYWPTRRLAAVLLVLAPIWALSSSAVGLAAAVVALALLLLAVLADGALVAGTADLDVEREAPRTVGVGDEGAARYRVRSLWPRAVRATLHDALPPAVGRSGAWEPALRLAAHGDAVLPFALVGRERGVHPLGPVVLAVDGPLGLVRRFLHYAPRDAITVAPSIAAVRTFRLLALQHRLRDVGLRNVRRRGAGTSFAGLREYAVGDDPRHLDWKATARRDKLIVREFTVEQGQTVMIAIDAGRMMTQLAGEAGGHPVSRFEYALSSALVLADVAVHSGDAVGLLLFDDEVRAFVPPARGRAALQAVRDALVPARATMAEPDYAAAFRTLAARHRKRSLFVLFTDVIDVRASNALIAHATRGAARHLPLVVALRNDALVEVAAPAGDDDAAGGAGPKLSTDALYERAAAEELLSARDAALRAMRRAGVSVVDVSPTAMTAAVVNRYLELKQRGAV
ncbi:MAG: DUF58 domain-containing protein [Gemmatimonadaceae bacterium]